jgi:hypothetical protein
MGPKMPDKKMNDEDERSSQDCFGPVKEGGDIQGPPGQQFGCEQGKSQHNSGNRQQRQTPEYCPVIELFPVSPTVQLGMGVQTKGPFDPLKKMSCILGAQNQRVRPQNAI